MDLLLGYVHNSDDENDSPPFEANKKEGEVTVLNPDSGSVESHRKEKSFKPGKRKRSDDLCFTRAVPHIRGNWCGHVFMEIDPSTPAGKLLHKVAHKKIACFREFIANNNFEGTPNLKIMSHIVEEEFIDTDSDDDGKKAPPTAPIEDKKCANLPEICYKSSPNLHISLSRPFYLQKQSIQPFINSLTKRLNAERALQMTFSTVGFCCIQQHDILVNDDCTRSFLTLSSPKNHTNTDSSFKRILSSVDNVMKEYNQPLYYCNPNLHVSIASMVGDARLFFDKKSITTCDAGSKNNAPEENRIGDGASCSSSSMSDDTNDDYSFIPDQITFKFDRVFCTFGTNKKFSIDLEN